MMTKEQVYDTKINPLMAQIIALCKEHKIALVSSFSLDDGLLCTSVLTEDEYDPPDKFLRVVRTLLSSR